MIRGSRPTSSLIHGPRRHGVRPGIPGSRFTSIILTTAGINQEARPTLLGAVTGVAFFSFARLGAGVDLFGFGPVATGDLGRGWHLALKVNLVRWREESSGATLALCWMF